MGYTLAGCASGPNILSDYDHDADFGSYHTYNFMEGAGPENSSYQSFFSQYMVEAITIEMEKRGYTKSDTPDLLLNFNAILQDKTKVRTTSAEGSLYYLTLDLQRRFGENFSVGVAYNYYAMNPIPAPAAYGAQSKYATEGRRCS